MAITNKITEVTQKVFNKIIDKSKELPDKFKYNKEIVPIVVKKEGNNKEELETIVKMLKSKDHIISELMEVVSNHDEKMNRIYDQLLQQEMVVKDATVAAANRQEDSMLTQIGVLKEENKECITELKGMMLNRDSKDIEEFEKIINSYSEDIIRQYKSNSIELDRMLMAMKSGIEKKIDKFNEVINKRIDAIGNKNKKTIVFILIITIINFIGLYGYIAYDLLFK